MTVPPCITASQHPTRQRLPPTLTFSPRRLAPALTHTSTTGVHLHEAERCTGKTYKRETMRGRVCGRVFQLRVDSTLGVAQRKLKYANNHSPDAT